MCSGHGAGNRTSKSYWIRSETGIYWLRKAVTDDLRQLVGKRERLPSMPAFICTACGTQYSPSEAPPEACPICNDERQFVPASGQSWTTLEKLRDRHSNKFCRLAPGLTTIETSPAFGIGQRAILVNTPNGNVLWDCIALVDDATVDLLQGLGGLSAIAISHPHYYTTMVEWSRAFGGRADPPACG